MLRLALAGGLMSGKSTLARRLVNDHGFAYVNYTDMLKTYASVALQSIGLDVSVGDMHADKERYRGFIIEVGTLVGFDQGFGIDDLVAAMDAKKLDRVVFDCVRFDAQYEKLRVAGFRLVRIETPLAVRWQRALAAGMDEVGLLRKLGDATERPLSHHPGEVSLSVDGDMEQVIAQLTRTLLAAETAEREGASA